MMTADHVVAPVEKKNTNARRSYSVTRNGEGVIIRSRGARLGFSRDQALQANRAFVQQLYTLSQKVDSQKPYNVKDEEALKESLRLRESDYILALDNMRTIGAGLRDKLSRDLVEVFKAIGFLREGVAEEPALTFEESAEEGGSSSAPILWEMFYEGKQSGEVDWNKFWGFRIPIAHWVDEIRTEVILLNHGMFSAISDELDFAGREIELLTQRLKQIKFGLSASNLGEILKKRVDEHLRGILHMDPEQLAAWWEACPARGGHSDTWLCRFFEQLSEDPALREFKSKDWKKQALAYIFKDSGTLYDLIHFACHCEPHQGTEFLSRLDMKVAGAPISLEVGFMADLRRQETWNLEDPGPLVFLNACSSAQQGPSHEPPGFPVHWIECQGALAVVATLCPVPDYFAHAFASKFYDTLLEGISSSRDSTPSRNCYLAEALLATKRYFMDEYNNPLGLAYVLYANNDARIKVDSMEAQ